MHNQQQQWLDEQPVVISVREVHYDPLEDTAQRPAWSLSRWRRGRLLFAILMLGVSIALLVAGINFLSYAWNNQSFNTQTVYVVTENENVALSVTTSTGLAPFFTPEVLFWEDDILRWAELYDLDPNLVATVMQIESCGDPTAGSPAGAQGLFQVMPFHFSDGEVMQDPDTNAFRGMSYLIEGLEFFDGDYTKALAGYNGGHGTVARGYHAWALETRNYHTWAVGIYEDARAGNTTSTRLSEWLASGGSILCNQAAAVQRTLDRS